MAPPFAHSLRVRYVECDKQGVVFNSRYLEYFDVSMTELWRAGLGGYGLMLERGIDMVVAEARLTFHRPAHFDDLLDLEVAVAKLGTTSILTEHVIRKAGEVTAHVIRKAGEVEEGRALVVQGTLLHVLVDRHTLQKTPIPQWMRDGLAAWTEAPPT